MIFADVIVDISVKSLDRPFQYKVPEEWEKEAVVGAQVVIPFGRGNRLIQGFIIGLSEESKYDIDKTKSIERVEKQGVTVESHLLSLAYWLKENYGSTMNDCIKTVIPVRKEVKEKLDRRVYPLKSREELETLQEEFAGKKYAARVRVLKELLKKGQDVSGGVSYSGLLKAADVTSAAVQGLEKTGILKISEKRQYRNPISDEYAEELPPVLNREQEEIVTAFVEEFSAGLRKNYLIHGVTGSGKTEVYMRMIEQVVKTGRQAIVLIPEIALTFQTVKRFYQRFGEEVSVIHSRLSAGERYDQFLRAKNGEIKIMIGPRSALFTPFQNLGLIVMDEEHETSYASDNPPKFHAREVAIKRAEMLGASVVFGSATPSLEIYLRCMNGECTLFTMKNRVSHAAFPEISIVDMREEFKRKNYTIFSHLLQEKIEDRLHKKEQIMLFINRRGYAGFVSCRSCGEAIECENCSVSMKPHEYQGKVTLLKCHYCGAEKQMPKACPSCGSKYIGTFGLGTQQVEDMVMKRFPEARVLRMDADTTSGKEGHKKILEKFSTHQADILIGTQMIVKGHDFPEVTLVGVLAADLSLYSNDYRSAERTFELLVQAAGRAGRGEKPGEVVLQTYQPEHYSVTTAARGDYEGFYRQEIAMRQILQYPPISNILEILVCSEKKEQAERLSGILAEQIEVSDKIRRLGPVDAQVAKLRNQYRRVIYLKSADYKMLCRQKDILEAFLNEHLEYKDCRLIFTFN